MITHSSFPNLHGPRLENQGGAAYIYYSTATFTDSSFGSNSAVRCVCCDTNVLSKIFKHSTYAWARAQASLVTSSRPHHTLAVMPTHTLMHTPHPPTHSVVVSTMCPHRRRPVALWCGHHLQLRPGFIHIFDWGFCLLQYVSRHARARHLFKPFPCNTLLWVQSQSLT